MTAQLRLRILELISFFILLASAVILINPVFAQDATSSTTRREKTQQRVEAKKERVETRVATKEAKVDRKITTMREKMATKEAALKAKLEKFRDKNKAEIADRVNTNLNKINQNQTEQMQKHLVKMSALLDKLEARVNKSTSDIKDPQAAKAAIGEAKSAIASASSAVSTTADKDYTLQVTTESKVKAEAQAKRDQLHKDLQETRKLVIEAKQAVANAIKVSKSGKVMEGTASGQQ